MREFKTILCPTDFSEESYRAIDYGARFAKASDGRLLLAHIIHVPQGELYQPDRPTLTFEEGKALAMARMEEIRHKQLADCSTCELLVDIGDPYEQLKAIADDRKVDLIVIATHGRTALQHLVMGSVAEKLIRHAPCPVLVVRRDVN